MEKSLGARLLCVAQAIPECGSLIDCGCDHGYVSIYAARRGIAEFITASDIKRGPLNNAEKEIAAAGQSDKIKTVLTDGLNGIEPHDCVVIAGMGGETIIEIISRAPWVKNGTCLILQPMTRSELLREYLYREGFSVEKESFVREHGHLYCVLTVLFCGKYEYEPYEKYISRNGVRDPLASEYADKIISRLEYEFGQKRKSGAMDKDEAEKYERDIRSLKDMREKL